jgi:hypothetical protein
MARNRALTLRTLALLALVAALPALSGCDTRVVTLTGIQVSPNLGLTNLVPSVGTLNPAFNGATLTYQMSVDPTQSNMTFTPTVAESGGQVTVNGFLTKSGQASEPVSLDYGVTAVSIQAVGGDGITQKTYTVNVTRPIP